MATKARSPHYPAFSLARAIDMVRKVHAKTHTHRAPPIVIANAMGYTTLNGKSLGALSALKKYDLLEDAGGEFRVSKTALTILFEPANTASWKAAMLRAARAPELFARLCAAYPGSIPGDELVRSFLLQNGFLVSTVDIPMKSFRDTMELVKDFSGDYNDVKDSQESRSARPETPEEKEKPLQDIEIGDLVQWESNGALCFEKPRLVRAFQEHEGRTYAFVQDSDTGILMEELLLEKKGVGVIAPPAQPPRLALQSAEIVATPTEKEWLRGPLSKGVSYRLIVSGEVGSKEIGKLIKLLEAQKLVLEDDDFSDMA